MLVRRAAEGDRGAFTALLGPHLKTVFNFVRAKLPTLEDAEDVSQETVLAAWEALPGFGGRSEFRTWLLGLARRKTADFYRARRVAEEYSENEAAEEDFTIRADENAALARALESLEPYERELVFLIFTAQLSYAEAADVAQVPVGTVKSRMSAVRKKLRELMEA